MDVNKMIIYRKFFHTVRIHITSGTRDDNVPENDINKVPQTANRCCIASYLI